MKLEGTSESGDDMEEAVRSPTNFIYVCVKWSFPSKAQQKMRM